MMKGKRLIALMMSVLLTVAWCCPTISNATVQSTEIVQEDVLYADDFSTDTKYTAALGDTSWSGYAQPTWSVDKLISGDYTEWQKAKYALLNGLGADSWMNYTVEADITANTEENDRACYVAAYGTPTGSGTTVGQSYQFVCFGQSQKFSLRRAKQGEAESAWTLKLDSINNYFENFIAGGTIRMSITAVTYEDHVNLICKATYGGETKEIFNYKDYDEARYTCGMPGFGLQQQNSSLDNVKVTSVTLLQLTEEEKYICLDNQAYSVSETGIVLVNGKQQSNGSALTQAGDYTVATTADSVEVTGMVVLYYTGDATGDKKADELVDVKDLVRLKRGMENDTLFTKAGKQAANMNSDSQVDDNDAKLLRDMLVQ